MQYTTAKRKTAKKASTFLILSLMLASLTGCGKAPGEAAPPAAEPIPTEAVSDENETTNDMENNDTPETPANTQPPDSESNQNGKDSAPQNDFAPQSDTELDGSVKSVGEDSFVVSQSFTMPSEDSEDAEIMVAPAEGSEDEVLITVHVSRDTLYRIHTVKNGGVNGDADVEKTDAGFADIQEKSSISAHGHYENNDFWADEIIIHRFV